MKKNHFRTADEYKQAFEKIRQEGIHNNHLKLLETHYLSDNSTTTWAKLAEEMDYKNGGAVNLQYGSLSKRVAHQLKINYVKEGFWSFVLVDWANKQDPESSHTAFVLRPEVIKALQELGMLPKKKTSTPPVKSIKKQKQFWWVNQNQNYEDETIGGYLWSPKRNANNARNAYYENMREVKTGDIIFSYCNTMISAIGTAISNCYDAPNPKELVSSRFNSDLSGWMVETKYQLFESPIKPKEYIDQIRPHLPPKYSPLQQTGEGLRSIYLARISDELATILFDLLRQAGNRIIQHNTSQSTNQYRDTILGKMEDELINVIDQDFKNDATEKEQLIKSRIGQGRFRENVQKLENKCRITGVSDPNYLIASHIKPWRYASNAERLDSENGLMLAPNIDFLFDRGIISFSDNGEILVSPSADIETLHLLGIPTEHTFKTSSFTLNQKKYLEYHRQNLFLKSSNNEGD